MPPWLIAAAFLFPALKPASAQPAQQPPEKALCPDHPELVLEWQKGKVDLESANYSSTRDAISQPAYTACFWAYVDHNGLGEAQWNKVDDYHRCRTPKWQMVAEGARNGCAKWGATRAQLKELRAKASGAPEAAPGQADFRKSMKDLRAKRNELVDGFFKKTSPVIGVLDHEFGETQQAFDKVAAASNAKKLQQSADSGSLKGAKGVEALAKADVSKKAGALEKLYGGRDGKVSEGGSALSKPAADMKAKLDGDGKPGGGQLRNTTQAESDYAKDSKAPPPPHVQEASMIGGLTVVSQGAAGTYVKNAAGKMFVRNAAGTLIDLETKQAVTTEAAAAAAGTGAWSTTAIGGVAVPTVAVIGAGAVAVTGLALGGAYFWQKRVNDRADADLRVGRDFEDQVRAGAGKNKGQVYEDIRRKANSGDTPEQDKAAYARLKEKLDSKGWGAGSDSQ